jgi:hypothetical protein
MAPRLAFTLAAIAGGFAKAMEDAQRPIAKAATAAVGDAAAIAKRDGRRDIAAGGLSRKWQNALRTKIFPPQGVSMRPAAIVYHRIPYAAVFEEGAVIRGRPFLWLPTEHVPLRSGGRRMTPAQYARSIGPLVAIMSRSGTPLLVPKHRAKGSRRRPGSGSGDPRKPLYVGVPVAVIGKRFDIAGVVARAAERLPDLYVKHFEAD